MTLREQIEAASAKATPGDWFIQPIKGYPHDEVYGRDANGELVGICAGGAAGYEDAPLITLLVHAYRAGKLLVIEDEQEAVRRMAFRMWKAEADRAAPNVGKHRTQEQFDTDLLEADRVAWLGLATAALAALRGDKA